MSSMTISMTVCGWSGAGSVMRSLSSPGIRWSARSRWLLVAATISSRGVADQLLVGGEPPEPVDQLGLRVVVADQGHGLADQALRVGDRLVELGVLRVVGGGSVGLAVVERVDAGAGLTADARVQLFAEHIAVDGGVELVRRP